MSDSLKQYMEDHRRAVQLKQLDILKEIDALCQRHHIDYWLDGGTILGAVRHGDLFLGMTILTSLCASTTCLAL